MVDVLIRDVPEEVLALLRARASVNRRSLQQELLLILGAEASRPNRADATERSTAIRDRLADLRSSYSESAPEPPTERDT